MTKASKLWFCVAVALIAAAVADPIMESASNAGWFGPGTFTDHSTWDVIPALLVGAFFAVLYCCVRVFGLLAEPHPFQGLPQLSIAEARALAFRLLPAVFATQMLALYVMETVEQLVIYGHVLGAHIWLGGPMSVSLAAHGLACVLVTAAALVILRAFTDATVRFVRWAGVFMRLRPLSGSAIPSEGRGPVSLAELLCLICRMADRAPPVLSA